MSPTIETTPQAKPTPAELGITQHQYHNLVTIRDYLRGMNPDQFDMNSWCKCVVGTATRVIRPMQCGETWHHYAEELFGILTNDSRGDVTPQFLFLFGASWKQIDNTPRAAADRIDAFLRGECLVKE